MRRILFSALAVLALASLTLNVILAGSRTSNVPKLPADHVAQPRIGMVNLAKLLKEYKEGNVKGAAVMTRRKEVLDKISAKRFRIATLQGELIKTDDQKARSSIEEKIRDMTQVVTDLEKDATVELKEMSDHAVVDTYQDIKKAIAEIAEANNLDLVWSYVDVLDPKDEQNADLLRGRLNIPAAAPIYHKHVDITDQVLKLLNDAPPEEHAGK
ncbi:MAG TPA: OmpH family outer membrane protein [Gemmataceae bacterium]|jgi:Skp family chaperone for outer membrane proteins|nr:OmpH family outer membrane protein [Gemmataceae bacterium]